jgi:putative ABC transport system permease protein
MFQNYIATAVRSLLKNKLFSFINIMGLAIGLAASILIMLFVRYELSYENWLPNADNIYRVSSVWKTEGVPNAQGAWVSGLLAGAMKEDFPEVKNITRVAGARRVYKHGDVLFSEDISRVDPSFFDVFDFEFVRGDGKSVLQANNTVAISEKLATKYFGTENPIGQTLIVNNEEIVEVRGVFKDLPENTELTFNLIQLFDISSIKTRHYYLEWNSSTLQTYFTLQDGYDVTYINDRFDPFYIKHYPDETPETPVTDSQAMVALSIADAHLKGVTGDDYMPGGGMKTVFTFVIVAFLVVGVAVFNFVNSSTAVAQLRAKEVALRKTMGAKRRQLIQQFLSETAIICLLGFSVALILVELTMPAFRSFWDKPISADYLSDPALLGGMLILFPIVVLCAGYYPALYLTKFRPAETLTSNKSNTGEKAGLRKALVLVQFAVSIGLAIVATIIQLQFDFATKQNLGFERENKMILSGVYQKEVKASFETFEQEIERLLGVRSMARSYYAMGEGNYSGRSVSADWFGEGNHGVRFAPVEFGYFTTYNVPLLTGRNFNKDFSNDTFKPIKTEEGDETTVDGTAVINRTALKRFELKTPEDAIGKTIYMGVDDGLSRGAFTIVGVVEDFKERNVREPVSPTVFIIYPEYFQKATISLEPGSLPNITQEIERVWKTFYPNNPISYEFLDEKLELLYATAQRRSQMLFAFSVLAVIISALGLYGLASFTATRRTKEVGLRKVMGASSLRITAMMVRQFSMPVIWANVIAWPLAWYMAKDWLDGFEYRIEMDITIFIMFGVGALLIAWVTVGGHAWNVARKKPVTALRYE